MNEIEEIPVGSKRIWRAKISGDIIRIKHKKKYKEKFSFEDVYKEGEEKNSKSYLMSMLKIRLNLDKDDEEFKITEIEKIKYLGFSVPPLI